MSDKIIRVSVNLKETLLLILRKRVNKNNKGYVRLVNSLIEVMTDSQLRSVVKVYNGIPVMLMDDVVNCFKYKRQLRDNEMNCICGAHIKEVHLILNKETRTKHYIGSTCCHHWGNQTPPTYTNTKRKKTLRAVFDAIKKDYDMLPKFPFGKYKNHTLRRIAKQDYRYCKWLVQQEGVVIEFKEVLREAMQMALNSV